jgi:hypothetical protein
MEFVVSPMFAGMLDYRPPHVVLVIDPDSADADTLEGSVEPTANLPAVGSVIMPLDLEQLRALGRAKAVTGRFFGLEFALTPSQLRSVAEFDRRVSVRPR